MPYQNNEDLPPPVRARLPTHAQDIFRDAFNHAFAAYGGDEGRAFRTAWSAVKRRYVKVGEVWLPREPPALD